MAEPFNIFLNLQGLPVEDLTAVNNQSGIFGSLFGLRSHIARTQPTYSVDSETTVPTVPRNGFYYENEVLRAQLADVQVKMKAQQEQLRRQAEETARLKETLRQQEEYARWLGSPERARLEEAMALQAKRDPHGHYKTLSLDSEIGDVLSPDKVDSAVRHMSRLHALQSHPDLGGNTENMQRINRAHEVLKDQDGRKRYKKLG